MSGKAQYDSDGDVVVAVSQPVFEFTQAPRLTDWSQTAIVKWNLERTQYEDRMRQRCADSGEALNKALVSVKLSVEPKLLEAICLYELRTGVDDTTEEKLVQLLRERSSNIMNNHIPDLDVFVRENLNMQLHEAVIDARMLKYYRDLSSLNEHNGFGRILGVGRPDDGGYEDRMKLRCSILLDNLEPQVLQDDARRYVKYEYLEAKKNGFTLFGVIKERARAQHKYHILSMENKLKMERKGVGRLSLPAGFL